jgi:hypothetical protein
MTGARVVLLAVVLSLIACQPQTAPTAQSTPPQKTSDASKPPDASSEFNTLVSKGDYAGAIAFVEKSGLPADEKDGITGTLILDGLVDPNASTRPAYPLGEGFIRMERAVSAGRTQSAADLRAKFTTGINYEGKNILMPPNEALANCWTDVEAGKEKSAACIAMRQRLRIPER